MILSLIIPAYNSQAYLESCINSCLKQNIDRKEYEIIIVNDGSQDRTQEIAEDFRERYGSMIKIISQENKGLSEARNAGMKIAEGEYLMFIDSDDLIAEDSLEKIIMKCMEDRPDMLRICAADMTGDSLKRRYSYERYSLPTSGRELLGTRFQVCAPFAVYRKAFLTRHALVFYPGIFHEDNEFTPRAYYHADKVCSINDIIYHVRQTPGSITRSANPKKSHDLLKTVSLLEKFAEGNVDKRSMKHFDRQMADCINTCFRNMNALPPKDKKALTDIIYGRRSIFRHFLCSSSVFHKIEGVLLTMCPGHMLGIFTALDKIRRSTLK